MLWKVNCKDVTPLEIYTVAYWRTTSQIEVDFILGDHEVALEVKATAEVLPQHIKGLQSFSEEYKTKRLILVSLDRHARQMGSVRILPWKVFLDKLWAGEII